MEDFNVNFNTLVTLIGFVITSAGLYWKMRIDLTKLDLKIAEIQCDRAEKWKKHGEAQDKQDAISDEILRSISNLSGDIKAIKESIDWLKKSK